MPIVLAAWITNIAFTHVERLVLVRGKQDHSITDISEITDIQSHWTRIHTDVGEDPATGTLKENNRVFAAGSGLTAVPAALQTLRRRGTLKSHKKSVVPFQNTSRLVPSTHDDSNIGARTAKEAFTMLSILEATVESLKMKPSEEVSDEEYRVEAHKRFFAPTHIPLRRLMQGVRRYLDGTDPDICPTIVFGSRMTLETMKTHLYGSDGTLSKINFRVEALKFAQQIKTSVVSMLTDSSLQADEELGYFFNYKDILESYVAERRFDLDSQSPWIAGNEMVELLLNANRYGAELCITRTSFSQ